MTIGHALTFIKRGMGDAQLRSRLNVAGDIDAIQSVLNKEKLVFSFHDFDEAYHYKLLQCQEEYQAEQLKSFRLWWEMLIAVPEEQTCG